MLYPFLPLIEVNITFFFLKKTSFIFIKMKECFKFETAHANVGNVFWRSISLLTKFVCFFGCLSTLLKRKLLEGKISPCLIHLMSAVPVLEPRQILQSPYTYTSTHAISISQPSLFWPKKKSRCFYLLLLLGSWCLRTLKTVKSTKGLCGPNPALGTYSF